jgi:hypothetical protein
MLHASQSQDEFLRLVDRRTGAEEVVVGPAAVSPALEDTPCFKIQDIREDLKTSQDSESKKEKIVKARKIEHIEIDSCEPALGHLGTQDIA